MLQHAIEHHGRGRERTDAPFGHARQLGKLGWRKSGREAIIWSKDGLQVRHYHPKNARGLEFDAVVVMEPGAFPENVGRETIC